MSPRRFERIFSACAPPPCVQAWPVPLQLSCRLARWRGCQCHLAVGSTTAIVAWVIAEPLLAARCSLLKALGQAAPVIVVGPPSCTMRQLKAAFWAPLQCPLPLPAQLATKKVALIRSQTSRRSSIPPLCPTSLQCGRVFRRATTSALRRRWRAPGKHPFASSGTGHLQIARYKGLSVCHRRYFLPRRRPGAQQHRSRPGADDF